MEDTKHEAPFEEVLDGGGLFGGALLEGTLAGEHLIEDDILGDCLGGGALSKHLAGSMSCLSLLN